MMRPASMRAVQRSMAPARRYMSTQQQQSSSTGTHAAAVTSEASTSVSLGKLLLLFCLLNSITCHFCVKWPDSLGHSLIALWYSSSQATGHCMRTATAHLLDPALCFTRPAGKWKPGAEIRMLYDGECSLCMKEVEFLQGRDAAAGKIDFVDIAEPSYSPEDNAGITFQAVRRLL